MRLLPVGRDAVLVEVDSTPEATALYVAAFEAGVEAREIVPAARTVLFDGVGAETRKWLRSLEEASRNHAQQPFLADAAGSAPQPHRTVSIPTSYDGPDLAETASLLGMSTGSLVELHTSTTFTVAFCGFAPGFAYCTGPADAWGLDVPRLASPRPRVEPGSVGLAGEFTGVYPHASPGGWRIIGTTAVRLWDSLAQPPALLTPGTTVRFEAR